PPRPAPTTHHSPLTTHHSPLTTHHSFLLRLPPRVILVRPAELRGHFADAGAVAAGAGLVGLDLARAAAAEAVILTVGQLLRGRPWPTPRPPPCATVTFPSDLPAPSSLPPLAAPASLPPPPL